MKGSNSRFSHRPEARYSNSAHIQGGMVTDADLTEAGQLHQARDEAQNAVTVRSGSPVTGGAVVIGDGNPALPGLAEGWVIADGKQGALRSASGAPGGDPLALFTDQADLPLGPQPGNAKALLYADLWERPVFALQDPYLADPGLHGAETSYRTRTMTQIKALPLADIGEPEEALKLLQSGKFPFAPTGTALATVKPKKTDIAVDDCDPCADQINVEQTLPNALFRLEVIAVKRNAEGKPTQAQLAWSIENAAAIETTAALSDSSARAMYQRKKAVYEFFSEATEAQAGSFPGGHDAERPVLTEKLFPAADPAGGANDGKPYSHVRRWDGAATLDIQGGTVKAPLGTGKMELQSGKATLTLDLFTLELKVKDAELVAGDYWLVELRRFALEEDRVRLVGADGLKNAPPAGIRHHFCALFVIEGGNPLALDDAGTRRLSFPPLTDVPASHVSFAPDCPEFFDQAENVAEALNALCDLDATEVAYHPSDDCERFEGTKTVHDALEKLCKIEDDTSITRVLRLMMDWGVICGLDVVRSSLSETKINWTGGTMLDRPGRLIDVKAGQADLTGLPASSIHGKLAQIQENEGEICISFAADKDGNLTVHLSDRETAFGPSDPTFEEALKACQEGRKRIDFGKIVRPLNPAETMVLTDVVNVWANRKALGGSVALNIADARVAAAVNKTLAADYAARATPENAGRVKTLIELAEAEYNPNLLSGAARAKRRMQLEAIKLGILANAEEEDQRECNCIHALIPCPPDAGAPPYLVPVACAQLEFDGAGPIAIVMVSPFCCRKQAMTWRSYRYVKGDWLNAWLTNMTEGCLKRRKPPTIDLGDWLGDWDDNLFPPYPYPIPLPPIGPDPIWPPKIPPRPPIYEYPYPIGKLPGIRYQPLSIPKPSVEHLPPAAAAEVLFGSGFEVVETIDLDDGDPLTRIKDLGGARDGVIGHIKPEPGDKVVMMARDGKVVDYVLVKKGNGKLPFETKAELDAKVAEAVTKIDFAKIIEPGLLAVTEAPVANLLEFESRLNLLIESKDAAKVEVDRLIEVRETLAGEVRDLEGSFAALAARRAEVAAELNTSKVELANLEREKAASIDGIRATAAELEAVKKSHAEFVTEMRLDQPIEALITDNPEAVDRLRASGIVSVRDIEAAETARLTSILRNTGLTGRVARANVNLFVRR